jgi:dihydroneopterin aldolase
VISCEAFMADLGNYLEGDMAADVRRQPESHLAHCRTCQVLYDSVRKTLKIVTDGGSFELPEAAAKLIADKIMAKIRQTSGT